MAQFQRARAQSARCVLVKMTPCRVTFSSSTIDLIEEMEVTVGCIWEIAINILRVCVQLHVGGHESSTSKNPS